MLVAKESADSVRTLPSILSYFPGEPREVQRFVLEQLEQNWGKADVFVVNVPVAGGKSRIATTIARWADKASILVPNRILNEQYVQEQPDLCTLRAKETYRCKEADEKIPEWMQSCAYRSARKLGCRGCVYQQAKRRASASRYGVFNYHVYAAHRLYKSTLIVDEAHNLVPFVKDRAVKVIWSDRYGIPSRIRSYDQLVQWLKSVRRDAKLDLLLRELTDGKPRFLVQKTQLPYRGKPRDALKLLPIDVSNEPPILWPGGKVQKIVLLSATIGMADLRMLGLDKRRILYIEGPSPIPVERRPCYYQPVGSMSYAAQDRTMPLLIQKLQELAKGHAEERGLIHAPYSLAARIKDQLKGTELGARLLTHDKQDRSAAYQAFRSSAPGTILLASGMEEGIDLPYDAARWQVITKVPYPSLAEPAIRWQAEKEPELYAWETAKKLLQASGRVCRTPTDMGVTYILDSSFQTLYNNWKRLLPAWFVDSVIFVQE